MEINVNCVECGEFHNITVDRMDYFHFQQGELPQHAFPYLSSSDQQLLVSKICGECFEEMFAALDEN